MNIIALATPYATSAISMIRISGPNAIEIVDSTWKGKSLKKSASHTAHLGTILDADGSPIDQTVATIFKGPGSFTGEDTVELTIHGSKWIQRHIINRFIDLGVRPAQPGEFSKRAFLNGKLDLAQAEAVADLISSSSKAAHRLAMSQLDGSFSKKLNYLRDQITQLASLIELELDFSEEDVEFANRNSLLQLARETRNHIQSLAKTYSAGKAFKEGIPVAIIGQPNAGKSTLLNALLEAEKAIVTDIPGTTRDIIEDTREIDGILFRFIDTAGIRSSLDKVEQIGIDRALKAASNASIILWVIDSTLETEPQIEKLKNSLQNSSEVPDAIHILIINKTDISNRTNNYQGNSIHLLNNDISSSAKNFEHIISISAKQSIGIEDLKALLVETIISKDHPDREIMVTNERHYHSLLRAGESIDRAIEGIESGISADFTAQDIREVLHHLGEITGAITTTDLLSNIFQNFCIGK